LLAQRKTYYRSAIQFSQDKAQPTEALWPLITTWTEAVVSLPDHPELQPPWIKSITTLGFAGKDYQIKLAAFDSFLDMCETLILGETAEAETET
jgi:glucose-6-phosphate dehydrogenase assembly protein OpcA